MNSSLRSALRRLRHVVFGVLAFLLVSSAARADKLRDLCDVVGARDNQLVGYGIVTGLNGTGDDVSAPFAAQSLKALLRRLGVQIDARQVRLRNVAAVLVTATIPPFMRSGARLDVTVSSIGNARSLTGGILIQTPLHGADRKTYAVAQGPMLIGGFSAEGSSGASVQSNSTTTARIPNGALVEREIKSAMTQGGRLTLALRSPDYATVNRVVDAVAKDLGPGTVRALDGGSVEIRAPRAYDNKPVELIARLGELDVTPSENARVVVNERTGTIVVGGDVRLSPVAIAQGGITVTVQEFKDVSQPAPFADRGRTEVTKHSEVSVDEKTPAPSVAYLKGAASLADVANALAALGVSPRELASILQALKSAGALRAEVVVQ